MSPTTRKRKTESQDNRCFSNLTNFKSPKSRKKTRQLSSNKKLTSYFSPVGKHDINQLTQSSELSTQSSQIVVSQLPTQTPGKVLEVIKYIKKVLEHNSMNVSVRLQLEILPPYLYDIQTFSNQKDVQFASSECEYMAKNYLEEDRHVQFIIFVRNVMCGQKQFPDFTVLRGILDLILKISDESQTLCCPSRQVLSELHSLFTSIIATFPPPSTCSNGKDTLRNSYLKLFKLPFKVFGIRVASPEQGIFHSMLELLSDLIYHGRTKNVVEQSSNKDKLINFFLWDAHKKEKSSFINFQRSEKFERIFLVLDLLVQVFENDLAMFIVKCSNKLPLNIKNEQTCPLVCLVLWKKHESLSILNSTIKSIITIFINIIALNYPSHNIQVISRLLNVVSHVLNLNEYPEDTIDYPSYKNNTLNLVHEIHKTIENSVYYNMELIVSVVEKIRSPLIQMLLVNQVLENIHKVSRPISLEVPFDLIKMKEFAKFKNVTRAVTKSEDKYPIYDPKIAVKPLEVYQKCYLKLLKLYADGINKYYQIQAVLVEAKKHDLAEEEEVVTIIDPQPFDFANFEEKLAEVDLSEKVKLRQVDMSFNRLVHINLSKSACSFYLNQIKYFWLLIKLIKICRQKYGGKFDDWMKLIDEMESGL